MNEPTWSPIPGSRKPIHKNWLFDLRREIFRSNLSGKEHDYFVITLADAVNVIAVTPDDEVVMVRQFRAGSNESALEIPGGLLDEGENPLDAGVRELLEETGYAGDPPRLVLDVFSNPSLMTSRSVTILIENARLVGDVDLDESEEMTVELVPRSELVACLRDGRINHALVAAGLLAWLSGF